MIGFGQWAMPTVDEFDYTFDTPTDVTAALLEQLGVDRFAVHAQGYGAPIAWRLATRAPQRITAIITQNGNGSTDGFVKAFCTAVRLRREPDARRTKPPPRGPDPRIDPMAAPERVVDPSLVSPDSWTIDRAPLDRPGQRRHPARTVPDYPTNVTLPVAAVLPRQPGAAAGRWGSNAEILARTEPAPSTRPARRRDPSPRVRTLRPESPPGNRRVHSRRPRTRHLLSRTPARPRRR